MKNFWKIVMLTVLCLSLLWLGEIVLLRVPLPAACAAVAALYLLYRLLDAAGNRP